MDRESHIMAVREIERQLKLRFSDSYWDVLVMRHIERRPLSYIGGRICCTKERARQVSHNAESYIFDQSTLRDGMPHTRDAAIEFGWADGKK